MSKVSVLSGPGHPGCTHVSFNIISIMHFVCLPFPQMFNHLIRLCCCHKGTMINKHSSKKWSKHCFGAVFLLNKFQSYLDSEGKQGINQERAGPIQIHPLYHKHHSSDFSEFSESNFLKNFLLTEDLKRQEWSKKKC